MTKQSLTLSDHKYVELQIIYRHNHLHIQGRGKEVNRNYGVAIDTKTKKLDNDTFKWLIKVQKTSSLTSLASSDMPYFFCQARIVDDKCHMQIPGPTHNRLYGGALDVKNDDLYKFIQLNLETDEPVVSVPKNIIPELPVKLEQTFITPISSITTKSSVCKMLPKDSTVFKTIQGELTNGHWLLKPKYVTKALEKRIKTIGGLGLSTPNSDPLCISSTTYPVVYKHSLLIKKDSETYKVAVYVNSKGQEVRYKEDYIAWLRKNIYGFSLKIGDPKNPAVIVNFGQIAGYLMPAKP